VTGTLTIRETSRTSPAARAGVLVAPAAVQAVRVARALAVRVVPAARGGLAAARAVLAGPLDPSARSATRSSSPTPCASSPT
jgi:hypothetical protein